MPGKIVLLRRYSFPVCTKDDDREILNEDCIDHIIRETTTRSDNNGQVSTGQGNSGGIWSCPDDANQNVGVNVGVKKSSVQWETRRPTTPGAIPTKQTGKLVAKDWYDFRCILVSDGSAQRRIASIVDVGWKNTHRSMLQE